MIHDGLASRGCLKINIDNNDSINCKTGACGKLNASDWLQDLDLPLEPQSLVEIRFKNTRKGIYRNVNDLQLKKGDIVAVEASPGHDIGIVSLTGELVKDQIRKYKTSQDTDYKKIYRKAKPYDIEKWKEAIDQESLTMLRTRKIADDLKLNMKIGDVEYQGDKTKAIFYYIAEERVDFRELIKILADEFHIRIEMRQIGARQEAGRIGGIGICGRELCCASWITNFISVNTNAARYQDVSLNPQKLAGQCGKLKCCLNYEVDAYIDAQKDFPDTNIRLETPDGYAYHMKTDVFRAIMWYTINKDEASSIIALPVEKVKEIISSNKGGNKIKITENKEKKEVNESIGFKNVVGEESITRFDEKKKRVDGKKKFYKKK